MEDSKRYIKHLLHKLGFRVHYLGYVYLLDNIELVVEKMGNEKIIQEEIYREIAEKYRTNIKAVEKQIRWIITQNWNEFGNRLLHGVTGYSFDVKPTTKQLVCMLSDYVKDYIDSIE